jgi:hypothetical protein
MNFGDSGYPLDQILRFVIGAESPFYPQFGELYERRIKTWATDRRAELDLRTDTEESERAGTDDARV